MVSDRLGQGEFDIVSEHLIDHSDKFAGAMPKGIVMTPAFSSLGIVVILESLIIFDNIVRCIHKGVTESSGSAFGHPGSLRLKVTGLINGRIQSGVCKHFVRCREAMDVADLTKDNPTIHDTDTGNGKEYGTNTGFQAGHLQFRIEQLAVK